MGLRRNSWVESVIGGSATGGGTAEAGRFCGIQRKSFVKQW